MSYTREKAIVLLKAQIEEWDRMLNRWVDTSMPAYRRTIKLKQEKQAELDRLLRLSQERVDVKGETEANSDLRAQPAKTQDVPLKLERGQRCAQILDEVKKFK